MKKNRACCTCEGLREQQSRPAAVRSIKIVGTGRTLPERVLSNVDLEGMVDTSDAWITERTGIKERRIAAPDEATSDLMAEALERACGRANVQPSELDAVIAATSTPDTLFPSTGCWVQQKLAIRGMPAFDVSAGCTGFVYALELAASLIESGRVRIVGIVAGEVMSRVINWKDRGTCVLFGDGAGAAIVTRGDSRSGILASNWGADGTLAQILYQPAGGTRRPASHETVDGQQHTVHMEGNTVFKHAVKAMSSAAVNAMRDAGVGPDEIALMIPHQANLRIMEATRERTGIPKEKVFSVLDRYGNMSAATIPVALDEAWEAGRLRDGDLLLLSAFGTGFTWGASIIRW